MEYLVSKCTYEAKYIYSLREYIYLIPVTKDESHKSHHNAVAICYSVLFG